VTEDLGMWDLPLYCGSIIGPTKLSCKGSDLALQHPEAVMHILRFRWVAGSHAIVRLRVLPAIAFRQRFIDEP
jgi:hypothetical protein